MILVVNVHRNLLLKQLGFSNDTLGIQRFIEKLALIGVETTVCLPHEKPSIFNLGPRLEHLENIVVYVTEILA
jgi:hypothetical protein